MSDAGLDLDTIRRMMRHSSVETTLRCYFYADPRKMKTAIDSVNGAFSAISC
jgi:integrase